MAVHGVILPSADKVAVPVSSVTATRITMSSATRPKGNAGETLNGDVPSVALAPAALKAIAID